MDEAPVLKWLTWIWLIAVAAMTPGALWALPSGPAQDLTRASPTLRQPAMFAGFMVMDTIVIRGAAKNDGEIANNAPSFYSTTCYVLAWIRSSGRIQAAQVVKSSGSVRLDEACLKAILNQKINPGLSNGFPVDLWAVIPMEWRFENRSAEVPRQHAALEPIAMPAPDQQLNIDRPSSTDVISKDAVCAVHVQVSADSTIDQLTLIRSTDSSELDKICTDAIQSIKFISGKRDGRAVPSTADFSIGWSANAAGITSSRAVQASPPAPRGLMQPSPQLRQALASKAMGLGMDHATGLAQRADCMVSVWFTGDGRVVAAQLVKTSGFPKIDQACLQVVLEQPVEPSETEREFGGWAHLPISWIFSSKSADVPQPRMQPDPSIPALTFNIPVRLNPSYPRDALAQQAQGICKMHVIVSLSGMISSVQITQSTGFAALDRACRDAIYDSPFIPATKGGLAVGGETDVAIDWRLPTLRVSR